MEPELEDLSQRFRRFAESAQSSALYRFLALKIAGEPVILRIAAQAPSRPATNVFFAAVQRLLLDGVDHPLRGFYTSLTPAPAPAEEAFPSLLSFCRTFEPEITGLLKTRRTQTNEVRRCQYLALGFSVVAREAGAYSVADVGSSAGLHLLWHDYGYDYEGVRLGQRSSSVQLQCRFEGPFRPTLPGAWPVPVRQVGIDLNPLDAANPDDALWLLAMVWPEHAERARLLRNALAMTAQDPPQVLAGDAFDRLPEIVESSPRDIAVCVCHNHTLNQFSEPDRSRFDALLGRLAHGREVYRLSAEWLYTEKTEFTLSRYRDGVKQQRLLARVDATENGWNGPAADEPR